jgi:glycosyltransferase involved in cell wall biosynthesis
MTKTILAFGYIPKSKGGKQLTGLATGIFDLHNTVNLLNTEFKVIIAATDIHQKKINIENTEVIGWNKFILIGHILKHPLRCFYFLFKTLQVQKFRPKNYLFKFIFLDYAIELTKPDAIHFHGNSGALLSTGLWKKSQKKILRLHGINGFDPSIPFYKLQRKLEKFVTGLHFEKVTFVAKGIRDEWEEKFGSFNCEMTTVLNGYDPNVFAPKKETESWLNGKQYDLITFSGVSERKGQIRVVEAINNLKNEGIELSYLIIGYGDKNHLEDIKKFVQLHNLNVSFIDYLTQKEIVFYLHQSKYFILPSITEGFGKVYIESIGAGIPVIIPKHLPLAKEPKILSEINSLFIDGTSTESITKGLREIYKKEKLNSNMVISNSVKTLQWGNLATEYLKIYKSIF